MADPEPVSVSVHWPDEVGGPVIVANQFGLQLSEGSDGKPSAVILTMGWVGPPLFAGSLDQQQEYFGRLTDLEITRVGQFLLNRADVEKLSGLLVRAREQWDTPDSDDVKAEGAS